jgi:Ca2+-binding EF-hand superfamily protein
MKIKRYLVIGLFVTLSGAFSSQLVFAASSDLAAFDPDKDGTLDLAEAKKAAADRFDKLDIDHEGTLDKKELGHRFSRSALVSADPDKDGTVSKDEYLALVEARFNAADPDKDGTLDAAELKTAAGKALLSLLK